MGPQLYRCGNELTTQQPAQSHCSFNGAATLSLRKYVAWPYAHGAFVELQWGRNFIVAEIRPIHCLL